jgi:hypothetical protein
MTRFSFALILFAFIVAGIPRSASSQAQGAPDFGGRWILNRGLSQFPREIGFNADFLGQIGPAQGAPVVGGGGRGGGRRGGGAVGGGVTGTSKAVRESQDDAERVQRLTAEVREPSAYLTIVDTPAAVTITDDSGKSRVFHPTGKTEVLQLGATTVDTITTRDAGRLVIVYRVEEGRDLRYTFTRAAGSAQVMLDVQFLERGAGDDVKRVYDLAKASDTASVTGTAPATAARSVSGDRVAGQPYNQQPDAELKGLTKLGVVVEDLSAQAAACGLNQGAIETAVSKHLTDAGFTVLRNTDEDTYVYVNIITTTASAGLCVSRYDVFLYTHTTTRLSYEDTPVLVQVELLHKGSLAGGGPAAHADSVLKGVQDYVDQFAARVRAANK